MYTLALNKFIRQDIWESSSYKLLIVIYEEDCPGYNWTARLKFRAINKQMEKDY